MESKAKTVEQRLGRYNVYGRVRGNVISKEEAEERRIHLLPTLASTLYDFEVFGWEPRLIALLAGTRDASSPLHSLLGLESTVLRNVYSYVASEWADHVSLTIPAQCVGKMHMGICRYTNGRTSTMSEHGWPRHPSYEIVDGMPLVSSMRIGDDSKPQGFVAFARCGCIGFPEPCDRNVNMMPFVIGDKSSLPSTFWDYYECAIEKCPYNDDEIGKVGYLTVHESRVEANTAQRREGLHIESPGSLVDGETATFSPAIEHRWGQGVFFEHDKFEGGIYMASSVSNTSELWDALVHNVNGIVDRHGGCEHLRRLIGPGTKLQANELVWMTDRTPHEALPQQTSGYRQFFRLVTSDVSHWYAGHSTPNPLVTLPGSVVVVKGNKFE